MRRLVAELAARDGVDEEAVVMTVRAGVGAPTARGRKKSLALLLGMGANVAAGGYPSV